MMNKFFSRRRKKPVGQTSASAAADSPVAQVPHGLPTKYPPGYSPDFFRPFPSYDMTETPAVPAHAYTPHGDTPEVSPSHSPVISTHSGSTQPPSDPASSTDPSDHHYIPYWDPRSPYYIGEPGTYDGGRLIIYPEGDRGFCPNTTATPAVTTAIKSQFCGAATAWPTWGQVPPNVKREMLTTFESKCKWHPSLDYKIRTNFPRKCGDIMKNSMHCARRTGKMPAWIYAHQWTELQQYWQSPEFLRRNEQGKNARASARGGSLHTGGSVSAATQRMQLEKKEGRTISIQEMHKIRHTKKDKTKGDIWVDTRSKETYDQATIAIEEHRSSQPSEAGSNTQAPLAFDDETRIWLEVTGGVKKGSAYGMGTLYASETAQSSYLGSTIPAPSISADPAEMARMKAEIADLKQQNEVMRKENKDHQTKMEKMMEKLLGRSEKRKKKKERKENSSRKSKKKHKRRQSSLSESDAESSSG